MENVKYFVDSSINFAEEFLGRPAHNPSILTDLDSTPCIFIASTQSYPEIKKQLLALCSFSEILEDPF